MGYGPEVIKAEHEIFSADKYEMPTNVGIFILIGIENVTLI